MWLSVVTLGLLLHFSPAAAPPKLADPKIVNEGPDASLRKGDKLSYTVAEDPIKSPTLEDVLVNAQGEAHFKVSRGYSETLVLKVEGKILAEVQADLKEQLEAVYYKQATIQLKLKEQSVRPGRVLLFGSIRNPFVDIPHGEPKKLLEAILQAGPNEFANLKKVKLSRIDPVTRQLTVQTINVEAIKKDATKDVLLRDGDRIEVPERGIVF